MSVTNCFVRQAPKLFEDVLGIKRVHIFLVWILKVMMRELIDMVQPSQCNHCTLALQSLVALTDYFAAITQHSVSGAGRV
jgi:hypothetical protein